MKMKFIFGLVCPMNKPVLDIRVAYEKLSKAEKRIADHILNDPAGLLPLSISELAARCHSSEATIVRFSRKLGYSGYQQLKISLAREGNRHEPSGGVTADDPAIAVYKKLCSSIYCSLEKTAGVLQAETLAAVCALLQSAETVYLFGLGNSAAIAADAAHKFLRLGLRTYAYSDSHLQAIAASHTDERCAVIGISHSGSSKDIVDALRIAKNNGAKTVAITNIGKSPLDKVSDYILHTAADETAYTILGLNSRIAQLTILDTIYSYLACHLPQAAAAIEKTETSLLSKKY